MWWIPRKLSHFVKFCSIDIGGKQACISLKDLWPVLGYFDLNLRIKSGIYYGLGYENKRSLILSIGRPIIIKNR